MKILASFGLSACLLASPALAGPAGTGLTFTEEVAKKNFQKRAAKAQAAVDCPAPKAQAAEAATPGAAPFDTCRAG
ncbi:hypothetical protein [Caulobacter sp. FWC2]|uniref:hypothetical protein n=1 Tax=Caulobacter sp. FWC2 TaxID=69664 RepID=UPI000C16035A|nr:hypothetical protein [Caulobacter sp. FWC2]PIB91861.1 hypothetical protein CSW62_09920 [Caulobacter sp. FWC2]